TFHQDTTTIPQSLCNTFSTLRGKNQKVFSLSIFGPEEDLIFTRERSLQYLNLFFIEVQQLFPDWFVRVYYHDDSILTEKDIVHFECLYWYVDFCNIKRILPLVSKYVSGRIWRFIPIDDTFVDIVNIRDLDSPVTKREKLAVNYWLNNTTKSFHVMRDHPKHMSPIQAGMWGVRRTKGNNRSRILEKVNNLTLMKKYKSIAGDEEFLADHLWPHIRQNETIVHDSFHCFKYGEKVCSPFPTVRAREKDNCFVGCWRPCCVNENC
ncbi:unnamed protein product, partial [Didymodactylos carnosus]